TGLDGETSPDVDEVLEFPGKRFRIGGEVSRVDSAGRHAGQDVGRKFGKHVRQMSEHSDLVRGTRTAAGEHESQIRPLVRNAYSLRRRGRRFILPSRLSGPAATIMGLVFLCCS